MKPTILFVHPWEGSYNKALLTAFEEKFKQEKTEYQLIDLYADDFQPIMTKGDLALYNKGETTDPLISKYQDILNQTNELIIISPIWWYELPAIFKGFIDKVMLKDFAYDEKATHLVGKLTHIKRTHLITTATSPKWYLKYIVGNYIQKVLINRTLKDNGIRRVKWHHLGRIKTISQEQRTAFIKKRVEDWFHL